MRLRTPIVIGILIFVSPVTAQTSVNLISLADSVHSRDRIADSVSSKTKANNDASAQRINLFVFSRAKHFNLASFLIKTSAGFSSIFNKRIKIINANSPEQLSKGFAKLMSRNQGKMISSLWFDSHGSYRSGNSLLVIGSDTLNYEGVCSERIQRNLSVISPYCDSATKISIGACYSAATFTRPGNDVLSPSKMNGDSLMLGLSNIFPSSTIYGSESWIMTKPFMLGNKWSLAGHPFGTKYNDEVFKPAWQKMGSWRMYDPHRSMIVPVNTVYLASDGEISTNTSTYLESPKVQKKVKKKVENLKPGKWKLN